MKNLALFGMVASFCLGGSAAFAAANSLSGANLIEPLRPCVSQVADEKDGVSPERKALLDKIAATIASRLKQGNDANLTFVCTHNSRRSHLSQIWAQTAAYYYGLDRVYAFSGGTEKTACNHRTIAALRRAGFSIVKSTENKNPVYLVQYSDSRPPVRAYSKIYNSDDNPTKDFIVFMTCSQADKTCPLVTGALARYALLYVDPKVSDDTPEEASTYDARSKEIAREMFYMMSKVRKDLDVAVSAVR